MSFWFVLALIIVGVLAIGMTVWFVLYIESSKEKKRNLTWFMGLTAVLLLGLFAQLLLVALKQPL